jgi:hypothetical protein
LGDKLTAEQLRQYIDAAVARPRHADEQRRDLATPAAMRVLAECCGQIIVSRPPGGPDLGAILIRGQFEAVLAEYGLVLMPLHPGDKVERAFRKGWFRSFWTRYEAAVKAAWLRSG